MKVAKTKTETRFALHHVLILRNPYLRPTTIPIGSEPQMPTATRSTERPKKTRSQEIVELRIEKYMEEHFEARVRRPLIQGTWSC